MKTPIKRVIIYPKDIRRITGKSERYGRKVLKKIKEDLSKKEHQLVTLEEFCQYTGIAMETVLPFITD